MVSLEMDSFGTEKACVYCGAKNVALSDEHIVPFALGGTHVLRGASCATCACITSKFELKVARGLWGQARQSYGAPTRRKKKQAKSQLVPDADNIRRSLSVPNEIVPAVFAFYKMPIAGVISGLSKDVNLQASWNLHAIGDATRQIEFEKRYGYTPAIHFRNQPDDFGRLLLKIGYCHMLTKVESQYFDAICLPYILGKEHNVSWLIGSGIGLPDDPLNYGYCLRSATCGTAQEMYLITMIKLWAHTRMPWYHAVVGKVTGREEVATVVRKLKHHDESLTDTAE